MYLCISCVSDPGFEGGGGDSTGMFQLGIILVLWIVIALFLFIFRSVHFYKIIPQMKKIYNLIVSLSDCQLKSITFMCTCMYKVCTCV